MARMRGTTKCTGLRGSTTKICFYAWYPQYVHVLRQDIWGPSETTVHGKKFCPSSEVYIKMMRFTEFKRRSRVFCPRFETSNNVLLFAKSRKARSAITLEKWRKQSDGRDTGQDVLCMRNCWMKRKCRRMFLARGNFARSMNGKRTLWTRKKGQLCHLLKRVPINYQCKLWLPCRAHTSSF